MEAIDFDSRAPHHSDPISDASSSLQMLSSAMIREVISTCSRGAYASKAMAKKKKKCIRYHIFSYLWCHAPDISDMQMAAAAI